MILKQGYINVVTSKYNSNQSNFQKRRHLWQNLNNRKNYMFTKELNFLKEDDSYKNVASCSAIPSPLEAVFKQPFTLKLLRNFFETC